MGDEGGFGGERTGQVGVKRVPVEGPACSGKTVFQILPRFSLAHRKVFCRGCSGIGKKLGQVIN